MCLSSFQLFSFFTIILGFSGVYTLTVRSTEWSSEQHDVLGAFSDVTFNVTINDVNDERPRFERPHYRMSLPESTPVGNSLPIRLHVTGQYCSGPIPNEIKIVFTAFLVEAKQHDLMTERFLCCLQARNNLMNKRKSTITLPAVQMVQLTPPPPSPFIYYIKIVTQLHLGKILTVLCSA